MIAGCRRLGHLDVLQCAKKLVDSHVVHSVVTRLVLKTGLEFEAKQAMKLKKKVEKYKYMLFKQE
jgi:hypothetical protein